MNRINTIHEQVIMVHSWCAIGEKTMNLPRVQSLQSIYQPLRWSKCVIYSMMAVQNRGMSSRLAAANNQQMDASPCDTPKQRPGSLLKR